MGWLFIAITILGTVYGQLVLKWQMDRAGALPAATGERVEFLLGLLINPWIISVWVAAAIAALAWMAALTRFELGDAYPFIGLTFVTTLIASAVLFGEELTVLKVLGTLVVVAGVVIASQG
ncbi:MAG: EamA family transporter [Actinobacteria bacterium]|nr:EamA family transporter [Actinomycetota bacterium]